MQLADRLERFEQELDLLRQDAARAAVIVEGRRDAEALEALGVGGTHLLVNTGRSLEVRIDEIAREASDAGWPRVVILTDWDRTGDVLAGRLQQGLAARAPLETERRRRLGRLARVACVQDLPADLASMRRAVQPQERP